MILADDLQLKELEKGNLRKKLAFDAIRMCASRILLGCYYQLRKWNWNFFSIEAHLREPFLYFYDKLNINLYVLDHTKGRWEQMYVYMYEHILTVPGPSQGTLMFSDSSQKPSIVFG